MSEFKKLAEKLGISEEALDLLTAFIRDDSEGMERTISLIGITGEALSKMNSQPVQQALAPALGYALVKQLGTDPFQQRILSLVSGLATIKTLFSDQGTQQLINSVTEQLKQLNERIQKIEESKKAEEIQKITENFNTLAQELLELKSRIEQAPSPQPQTQVQTNNSIVRVKDELSSFVSTIEGITEVLKALGYRVRRPGEEEVKRLTPDEIVKLAEEYGFEVKRKGMSPEEVRQLIEKVRKRAYMKAMKEAKIKEKELALKERLYDGALRAFIRIVEEIVGPVIKKHVGEAAEEELRKALNMRLKEIAGEEGKEQPASS